ncbi:MAG: RNA-binding protein [Lentisphaeria bacterium]|nr:RNA-binding protein [Lentisphaeria bacterium]
MNIYVGNMPYSMSEDDLRNLFGTYGAVTSARLVTDRDTGRAKGFGFVEMDNSGEAQAAIEAINGMKQGGRELVVNEARPREERPRREGGSRGGFGGGFGGGRRF